MKTSELIATLSQDNLPVRALHRPSWWATRLVLTLLIYGISAQIVLGVRPDILLQLTRPAFALEVILLASTILSAAFAAILSIYPDAYQKPTILKAPYIVVGSLVLLILYQLIFATHVLRMVIPVEETHGMECALCIAAVATIPAAFIFWIMRKGASVTPLQAGFFSVLAAAGMGALTLRLAEADDSLIHLAVWHYLPTFVFATIGALTARWLLKW